MKTKISSDLEWGAAPRSIAEEFFVFTSIVEKLQRCENTGFHFHAAPFGIRSPWHCNRGRSSSLSSAHGIRHGRKHACHATSVHTTNDKDTMQGGVSASREHAHTFRHKTCFGRPDCCLSPPLKPTSPLGASGTSHRLRLVPNWMLVIQRAKLERLTCTGKVGDQRATGAMHESERPSKGLS